MAAALLYGALWPLMNVAFIAYRFPLPFLADMAFYRRYSRVFGGPVQYSANLFAQSYSRHWVGVLAFTLLALAAWAIARGILRRFSPESSESLRLKPQRAQSTSGSRGGKATKRPTAGSAQLLVNVCSLKYVDRNWVAAAFPIIILILASRYMAIVFILPMIAGLATAWLYMALSGRPHNGWAQRAVVVLFLIASIPVYWLLASGFLYVCGMCALFELLIRKRPVWCLAWIAFGAAVPYGMSYVYYEPDISERYLRWMAMSQRDLLTTGLVAAMYLFVPVGAIVAFLVSRVSIGDRFAPRFRFAGRAVGFAALALLVWRLVALHLDTSGWIYADYLRENGRPAEALTSLAQSPDDNDVIRFLTMFALARTGRLPWEMFHYPQLASSDALLLRDTRLDTISAVAEWRSDLYLELGRVNESLRWAHEGLAMEGETPRVLERIALTYVLNGNPDAARTFVRALGKVPFQAARAQQYLAELDLDPAMGSDPLVARIRPLMLRRDYVGEFTTEQILQQSLDANPSNRMAFEYLLTHYLLTSDMKGFASLVPRLKEFYRELPTHVQEALLHYRQVNGSLPPGIDGWAINSQIESRFQSFLSVYSRYVDGSPVDGWRALAPDFGDTYWFFSVFDRSAAGPSPQLRADASQGKGSPQ